MADIFKTGRDVEDSRERLDNPETWSRIAVRVLEDLDVRTDGMNEVLEIVKKDPHAAYNSAPLWRNIALILYLSLLEQKTFTEKKR